MDKRDKLKGLNEIQALKAGDPTPLSPLSTVPRITIEQHSVVQKLKIKQNKNVYLGGTEVRHKENHFSYCIDINQTCILTINKYQHAIFRI